MEGLGRARFEGQGAAAWNEEKLPGGGIARRTRSADPDRRPGRIDRRTVPAVGDGGIGIQAKAWRQHSPRLT